MFNLENIKNLEKKLNSKFYYNYDIYKNTWFRTGGKTKVFCIIYDDKELEIILNNIGIIKYHIIILILKPVLNAKKNWKIIIDVIKELGL